MAVGFATQQTRNAEHLPPLHKTSFLLISLTFMAVMGGFLFGYDTGVVAGAMIIMRTSLNLNDLWQEIIVSITLGAAAIASLTGGALNAKFGRKKVILGSSVLFVIGAVLCAASYGIGVLLAGRIVLGLAIGISSCTIPAYVSECSPTHVRGRMITMFQLLITLGFWVAGLMDAGLSYIKDADLSWRLMLGLAAIPALIQLVGFFFMPESPRWLATHGREDEALAVMKRIFGGDDLADKHAEFELQLIRESEAEAERERKELNAENQLPIVTMLRIPHLRKALIIGCSLQTFQQLCGINTIMYYSATIVMMSGVSDPTLDIWLAAVTSGVNFFCTFIGIYLVEKIGRRKLLLGSVIGVFSCLIIMGTSFTLTAQQSPAALSPADRSVYLNSSDYTSDSCLSFGCDQCTYHAECGYCYDSNVGAARSGICMNHTSENSQYAGYGMCSKDVLESAVKNELVLNSKHAVWNYGYCPTSLSWLPILGMVLYLCAFSSGFGPMPWTINADSNNGSAGNLMESTPILNKNKHPRIASIDTINLEPVKKQYDNVTRF